MTDAPFGYFPGTKIPRKAPAREEFDGKGTCKTCGVRGLVWEKHGSRWRLVDVGGKPHVCDLWGKPPETCPCCGVRISTNYLTTATNATRSQPVVWRGFLHCYPYRDQDCDRSLTVCGGRINLDGSRA